MSVPDPIEDLLQRAVAADRAGVSGPDVAPAVLRRIRWRARLRTLVLGGSAAVGLLWFLLSGADPAALTSLIWGADTTLLPDAWSTPPARGWTADPTLIAALLLAGVACLAALGEEPR